jgi:hypothetical protein
MVEGLKLWEAVAVALAFILLAYYFLKMMAYVKVLSAVSSGVKRCQAVPSGAMAPHGTARKKGKFNKQVDP